MKKYIGLAIILLTIFLLAGCNLPKPTEQAQVDENAVRTSVAQTIAAQIEEDAKDSGDTGDEPSAEPPTQAPDTEAPPPPTDTTAPLPTDTLPPTETPTFTPSLTSSHTPTFTPSPTSSVPKVSVSVDTNCRTGPSILYDRIGALLVGESAVIVAQETTGEYWIIENPDKAGTCWLWAEYATVTGNVSGLPLLTPPPSPTPTPTDTPAMAFTVSYVNIHQCGPTWHITFQVVNTGSITLESADVAVVELASLASQFEGNSDVPFVSTANGCPPELNTLLPGNTAYIAVPANFVPNTGAHAATFRICSADGLTGLCLVKEINFTIQ
jgi:hypothetical protein